MPKIVIAANVLQDTKKFGSLVMVLGVFTFAAFLASLFVPSEAFSLGTYSATALMLILFYTLFGIFGIFLVAYLVKSGYGKKILDFIKSGKIKEFTEQVKSVKREVEEIQKEFPKAKETLQNIGKAFTSDKSSGGSKIASPMEVFAKLGSLLGGKSQTSVNRVGALQLAPSEGPAIVVVPKTRAPIDDVTRVAFLGERRGHGKLAVMIVSINIILVFTILLALILTGTILWGA